MTTGSLLDSNDAAAMCKVCGQAFPVWFEDRPNDCYVEGGMAVCADAQDKAHGAAMRRKVCPDAFDANGTIIPGQIGRVAHAMIEAGLDPFTGRPAA